MKLRKLARQLAAAAVAGAMALSLCMPALAETWDMSNTEKYPNGKGSWISVTRYADIDDHPELNGQFLEIWNSSDKPDPIKEKDEAPVLSGSFETLDLNGYDGTTVYATLQDAHIEYNADSSPTLTTSGNVELTLSGSNTVTHNNTDKLAIDIGDDGWPDYTPGRLTIKGSGSLTAEAPSSGIRIQNGTLDVTDGTVNATAADNGIYALGNTVQVSGGTLCATATGEHSAGIEASHNGQVTVSSGKLTASGGSYGIVAGQLEMSGGTLNASANGTAAITGSSITVNGGVLNLEDNTAPDGIISKDLNVTNGWLTAKGQTVSANNITVSGGVMEAALRTAVETLTGETLENPEFTEVRGTEGIKEASYNVAGMDVKVAVASGLGNAKKLLEKVKSGEAVYHFIEIMGCPGGCVNGGGQPQVSGPVRNTVDVQALRAKVLYANDAAKTIRKSHENPAIKKVYSEYFGEPGSHKAHEVLHTTYVKRSINGN